MPYGLKSKALPERQGFEVDDRHLASREEVDAFKAEHGVTTMPQSFIDCEGIGGFDDFAAHFGKRLKADDAITYQPVIALFGVSALLATAITWADLEALLAWQTIGWLIAIAMVLPGLQKLQDIEKFATMFLSYDQLAQRWPRYGFVYPFVEAGAGILMLMGGGLLGSPVRRRCLLRASARSVFSRRFTSTSAS